MYLHIGKDIVIKEDYIIGIFDIESVKKTNEYINIIDDLNCNKNLIKISNNSEKTLIIIEENEKIKGYITNISSLTLCSRIL